MLDSLVNIFMFFMTISLSPIVWGNLLNSYLKVDEDADLSLEERHAQESRASTFGPAVEPFVLALYNSLIIPSLVVYLTEALFFEKESSKVISRLRKFYGYMMINTIFLQLTKIYDINRLIGKSIDDGVTSIPELISAHLINESGFYFRYLLTAAFVS